MNIRKTTSLVAALTFLMMLVTSSILFIVPQGRIANWAGWEFFGLSKTQWGNMHINTGILFLMALALHTYYNWSAIVKYLKNSSKNLIIFTREFNLALVLTSAFVLGTLLGVQPFSGILNISSDIKDKAVIKYGEPPWGHAELSSLKTFTGKTGLDIDKSLDFLSAAGINVSTENETLASIGKNNGITPQKIFETIQQAKLEISQIKEGSKALPDSPPAGFGKKNLVDFCNQFKLDMSSTIKQLEKKGLLTQKEMTMKEIATKNNTTPIDLYEVFKSL